MSEAMTMMLDTMTMTAMTTMTTMTAVTTMQGLDLPGAGVLAVMGPDGRWQPGIGDPTVMGWVTVGAYALAMLLCFIYAVRSRLSVWHTLLWLGLAGAMLVLGVNKQLDLQSYFTQEMRDLSKEQGWYEQRRGFQWWFIQTMIGVGFVGGIALFIISIRRWRRNWLAMLGLAFLITFIVVRAAGFHNMDSLLKSELAGLKMNWILEIGGISIIILGALLNLFFAGRGSPKIKDTAQAQAA
jgi:hypothetical protein